MNRLVMGATEKARLPSRTGQCGKSMLYTSTNRQEKTRSPVPDSRNNLDLGVDLNLEKQNAGGTKNLWGATDHHKRKGRELRIASDVLWQNLK